MNSNPIICCLRTRSILFKFAIANRAKQQRVLCCLVGIFTCSKSCLAKSNLSICLKFCYNSLLTTLCASNPDPFLLLLFFPV